MEFCREMIAVEGPFAEEAKECLADPPKDHNDSDGNRMASHERAVSEPPYVRKQRLAPFRESEEYDQSRAEVWESIRRDGKRSMTTRGAVSLRRKRPVLLLKRKRRE